MIDSAEEIFLSKWKEIGYSDSDLTREYRFHPTRKWRFDFAFPSRKVAVEIDGRGRHQTVTGVRSDCEKNNAAVSQGWAVFHVPTTDLKAKTKDGDSRLEEFIEFLCDFLAKRETYDSINYEGFCS